MSSNFDCSYIAVSSFAYNPSFSVEFFDKNEQNDKHGIFIDWDIEGSFFV
jgi:hypothetical protein